MEVPAVRVNPKKRVGLFKSRSFSELHNLSSSTKAEFKLPPRSPREKSISQEDLNISGMDALPPSPRYVTHPGHPGRNPSVRRT